MKSMTLLFTSLAFLSCGDPGRAAEVMVQSLSPADFRPGRLKLPLVVTERSGVQHQQTVVTSGVPFPPGFLPDAARLAVVDRDGRTVPSQATCMVRWHKPAYDNSVQWALVSFLADAPAGGTNTYWLTDDGRSARRIAGRLSRRTRIPFASSTSMMWRAVR